MSSDIKHTCGNLAFDWTCKACIAGLEYEDFFAPPEEQRTLFQEDVCRPGWVEGLPLPAAEPLYTPNDPTPQAHCPRWMAEAFGMTNLPPHLIQIHDDEEPGPVPGGPGDDEYRRKAAEAIKAMRPT